MAEKNEIPQAPRPATVQGGRPWRGSKDGTDWDEKRACPFVIEFELAGHRQQVTCQGHSIEGRGGPAICAYLMADHERGDACPHWYHMCEIPPELATNCCWQFEMLVTSCVSFRAMCGRQQPYFSLRRHDWDKDVHRCYEEPEFKFCPYCGAKIGKDEPWANRLHHLPAGASSS